MEQFVIHQDDVAGVRWALEGDRTSFMQSVADTLAAADQADRNGDARCAENLRSDADGAWDCITEYIDPLLAQLSELRADGAAILRDGVDFLRALLAGTIEAVTSRLAYNRDDDADQIPRNVSAGMAGALATLAGAAV